MNHTLPAAQWANLQQQILSLDGITVAGESEVMAMELSHREQNLTHIKFASLKGEFDDTNGRAFAAYMASRGVKVDRRRDSQYVITNSDLVAVFGL